MVSLSQWRKRKRKKKKKWRYQDIPAFTLRYCNQNPYYKTKTKYVWTDNDLNDWRRLDDSTTWTCATHLATQEPRENQYLAPFRMPTEFQTHKASQILPEIMFQDYAFVFWVGFMNCLRCTNIRDWLPAALQLFDSLRKEKEETSSIWFTASSNRTPVFLVFNITHLVCPEW